MVIAEVAAVAVLTCLAILWLIGERGHLLLPSTRRTFRLKGRRGPLQVQTWHFYLYGRWPRLYIGLFIHLLFRVLNRLGHQARNWLSDHYHGKVLTLSHARSILEVQQPLKLRDMDQVIPYPTARNLLLDVPLEMVVFECPCRLARAEHCEPTQVCLIVGQPFVDLMLEHHPQTSRRISREEAVALVAAEHQRGHVQIAWFKDACLNRFFAICNCCHCCCGGIDAMLHHGISMIAPSGFVAKPDPDRCGGCGVCAAHCPFEAITTNERAEVDAHKCMGCGVCVDHCRRQAMALERAPQRGIPLDFGPMEHASASLPAPRPGKG